MVRFLHSADLQLGKPFEEFGSRAAEQLREYRLEAIGRLAEVADEREVDFAVLAGDVFDSNTLDPDRLGPALPQFEEFGVPVYVLPGNHDHVGTPQSVYERELFEAETPETVTVMDEREPVVVADGRAVLLPAPLRENQTGRDPTAHLDADFGADAPDDAVRIGVAHGAIGDKGEFTSANRIPEDRAERGELDYLALGDFHGAEAIDSRTWYAGAPERSNFSDNRQRQALVVELEEPGALPEVEEVETGRARWLEHEVTIGESGDVEALERWFEELDDITETVIRLQVDGTAPFSVKQQFDDLVERKSNLALSLERRGEVVDEPDDEALDRLRQHGGLVPHVVDALQTKDDERDDDAATRALSLLHRLTEDDR